ncbi:hypothetical protein V6N13_109855 [Hibiscus sabdariffa]|uniref:RNase H type-1 domain-containing protein n=1 Tax=Hibiscus sabdariffa TaxID=183260 RepID=A0ABR2FQP9_9ROSI
MLELTHPHTHSKDHWIPHPSSMFKVNVDAAESLPMLQGFQFALDFGLQFVIAESDSKSTPSLEISNFSLDILLCVNLASKVENATKQHMLSLLKD